MSKPSGGGSTNTVTQQSSPPPQFLAAYQNAVNQAQNVASTPYQPYGGQTVAPLNAWQNGAIDASTFGTTNYEPYAGLAQTSLGNAMTPFYQETGQYMSPYIGDVVNATEQQFNNQNAIQNAGVVGNAVAQGAWGGDRSAVAQGIVAGQQQANEAPVIANLYNSGYQNALSAAEAQGWLNSNLGAQENQLGQTNFNVNQATLNQMMQFGNVAQAETQANLNVPYYQYLAGQAYPFQTTGWLANVAEGLGSGAGGNSSTTSPGASPISQALGLGIGGAGIIGATGGFGSSGWLTGAGGLLSGIGGGAADLGLGSAIDATGVSSAADVAAGLPLLFKRGGGVRRDDGGSVGDSGAAAILNAIAATGKADVDALYRGGIVRRDAGGDVPFQLGAMPYQQMPASSNVPNVGISIVPQLPQMRGGMGPPRPPQVAPEDAPNSLSPQGILGMLQQSGGFGQNGWLGQIGNSGSQRGGGIRPHYQDGGDLVSGLPEPDQPSYLGISPDMRTSPGPSIAAPASAPSVDPASRAGVVQFWISQGANPKAAQGIADRVAAESGFNPIASGDLGTSHGLYQEHDTRAEGLKDFADSAGVSPNDPSIQNAFAASEVHGGDPIATKHWQEIANAPDEATGSMLWDKYFERSAGSRRVSGNQDVALGVMPAGSPQPPLEAQMTAEPSAVIPQLSTPSGGIAGQPAGIYSPGVNPWLALAAAGFATAAGRSPQAMQNIGAGMLAGVQTLEHERAAIPEMQLQQAQAQIAQAQAQNIATLSQTARAQAERYYAGHSNDPTPVVDMLDGGINSAKKAVASGPEVQAVPGPNGQVISASPSSGGIVLSADEQRQEAMITDQMEMLRETLPSLAANPAAYQAQAAKLVDLQKSLPSYLRAASQATAEGKVGPAITQAGGEAAARLPYQVNVGRPGAIVFQGGQPIAAVPQRVETMTPQGQHQMQWEAPPLTGQAQQAGANDAIRTGLSPGEQTQQTQASSEYTAAVKDAREAQENRLPLQAIQNAMQNFRTGPSAETRLQVQRAWQDFLQTAGASADPDLAKSVASGEVITKEGTRLGYELARTLGSREAQMIVQQAIKSNPSLVNSPQGNEEIVALIRSGLQRDEDKRNFFDQWIGDPRNHGSFVGASDAFQVAHPAEGYINRVIPPKEYPPGVPAGSLYSASRGMWRDPQGRIYNAAGTPINAGP